MMPGMEAEAEAMCTPSTLEVNLGQKSQKDLGVGSRVYFDVLGFSLGFQALGFRAVLWSSRS